MAPHQKTDSFAVRADDLQQSIVARGRWTMRTTIGAAVSKERESLRIWKRKTLLGLQRTLHYTGAGTLGRRFGQREGFIALMYHSVPDLLRARFVDPSSAIPAEVFDAQLSLLKSHCDVISVEDAMRWMRGEGRLPARAVVLTFDDGYLDNLEVAAPLLRWHKVPATLFLATGYVDRQERQWVDEVYCAFRFRQRHVLELEGLQARVELSSERQVKQAYGWVCGRMLSADTPTRRALLAEVKASLQPSRSVPRLTLNWELLRTMRRTYPEFELGVHGHDHLDLRALPLEKALADVQMAQQRFEQELGFRARYMTYPYGRCTPELVQRLGQVGIEAAFTTQPTLRVTQDMNPLAMPRYEVTRSLTDFRLWSEGVLPDLGRRIFGRVADQA